MRIPIIRIIVYWGLYWGPPIMGNYQLLQGGSGGDVGSSENWGPVGFIP